jgi:hypothetical protein
MSTPKQQPKPIPKAPLKATSGQRRFRVVKLEERIAPSAHVPGGSRAIGIAAAYGPIMVC